MNTQSTSLYHLTRPSKKSTVKAPALIMLHGYGSDENDLFSFASELPDELFIISARAPFKMEPYGNAWYAIHWDSVSGKFSDTEQASRSRDLIAKFINEVIDLYNLDPHDVTLLGFSQGTILSYAVALNYPEKVKNIIALSGYINDDLLPKNMDEIDYSKLDFYCSHGNADQVIPVDWARKSKPLLDKYNISNTYSEFPVGHGVAPQNFFEFKEWLKQRLK